MLSTRALRIGLTAVRRVRGRTTGVRDPEGPFRSESAHASDPQSGQSALRHQFLDHPFPISEAR